MNFGIGKGHTSSTNHWRGKYGIAQGAEPYNQNLYFRHLCLNRNSEGLNPSHSLLLEIKNKITIKNYLVLPAPPYTLIVESSEIDDLSIFNFNPRSTSRYIISPSIEAILP